jgi:hypothetical protein
MLPSKIADDNLPNFNTLGRGISFYSPSQASTTLRKDNEAPGLIILLTWMNSKSQHISKYILTYQKLYPQSQILVIRNSLADILYRPSSAQRNRLQPVTEIVHSHTSTSSSNSRILLHAFSNGGAQQTCQLANLWAIKHPGHPLPISAMILDSAPERGDLKRAIPALIKGLPQTPFLRFLGTFAIYLATACVWILQVVFGIENIGEKICKELNDERLLPKVPRCYFYSKEDEIIEWRNVERHAEECEAKQGTGAKVFMVLFEGTRHVAHVVGNEEKYWGAVETLWRESVVR